MISSRTEQLAEERLPYEKPVLRSISLSADQVLGPGCKTGSSIVSGANTCQSNVCYAEGS
jgi:hypothetical protein